MAFPCKTCTHPDRAAIDADLVKGEAIQGTARKYNLNPQALARHRVHHLSPVYSAVMRTVREQVALEVVREKTVKDRVEKLVDKLESLAFEDTFEEGADGEPRRVVFPSFLDVAAELRKSLEFLARVTGEVGPNQVTTVQVLNVATSPDFVALVARLMKALAPYPEAKAAVVAALGADA